MAGRCKRPWQTGGPCPSRAQLMTLLPASLDPHGSPLPTKTRINSHSLHTHIPDSVVPKTSFPASQLLGPLS